MHCKNGGILASGQLYASSRIPARLSAYLTRTRGMRGVHNSISLVLPPPPKNQMKSFDDLSNVSCIYHQSAREYWLFAEEIQEVLTYVGDASHSTFRMFLCHLHTCA